MGQYLARRLLLTAPVLLGVATLVFALIHLVPGDPARAMLGEGASPCGRGRAARPLGAGFLGLGIQPPTPSWGTMINGGRAHLLDALHLTVFPGLFLTVVVLGFSFLGDGLRDRFDPRTQAEGRLAGLDA